MSTAKQRRANAPMHDLVHSATPLLVRQRRIINTEAAPESGAPFLSKEVSEMRGRKRTARPPAPAATYSIREFCEAHRISLSTYFKMQREGIGPREMRIGSRVMISLESAAAWRRARES